MTTVENRILLRALGAEQGIVSVVGAGGKKTTLYHLLEIHPGRAAVSASTFTYLFPKSLAAETHVADVAHLRSDIPASTARKLAFACPSSKRGRLAGLEGPDLLAIHRRAKLDLTLLKSDGARARWIKAPATHEPLIPDCADAVILVQSVAAIGKPLDERIAHRPERVSAVTGLAPGETVRPRDLAVLFSHPQGLMKGVGDRPVVPLLHMVDDPEREYWAREVGRETLAREPRFPHVVLTSARHDPYLVAVVERSSNR
ncbi:selenium cofactor biosynthesis protein YqeC [Methylonatrum kenyense]|uniref:selenium cofactor biosynthesis protein YqeC n=1 Tax=Methylonatrum kenyense TaxID=455253 RepID=UPI0020C0B2DC|nr:selenium cofactor biosynthesis protein YqeC [Methylonatrum kenyense]MCK8514818.1 selenium cofactor biosynthesis protein YqeC [Methylonatrum kenyense]